MSHQHERAQPAPGGHHLLQLEEPGRNSRIPVREEGPRTLHGTDSGVRCHAAYLC
jgi:hypothetical protein